MQVGDLVRHIVHSGALGIIIDTSSTLPEVQTIGFQCWGEDGCHMNVETVCE